MKRRANLLGRVEQLEDYQAREPALEVDPTDTEEYRRCMRALEEALESGLLRLPDTPPEVDK